MSLSIAKPILKTDIKALLTELLAMDGITNGQKQADAMEKFATDLTNAIDKYTTSAVVPLGIPVTVVVPAGTGATTGNGSLV